MKKKQIKDSVPHSDLILVVIKLDSSQILAREILLVQFSDTIRGVHRDCRDHYRNSVFVVVACASTSYCIRVESMKW